MVLPAVFVSGVFLGVHINLTIVPRNFPYSLFCLLPVFVLLEFLHIVIQGLRNLSAFVDGVIGQIKAMALLLLE